MQEDDEQLTSIYSEENISLYFFSSYTLSSSEGRSAKESNSSSFSDSEVLLCKRRKFIHQLSIANTDEFTSRYKNEAISDGKTYIKVHIPSYELKCMARTKHINLYTKITTMLTK